LRVVFFLATRPRSCKGDLNYLFSSAWCKRPFLLLVACPLLRLGPRGEKARRCMTAPAQYALKAIFNKRAHFLDPNNWQLFAGRMAYNAGAAQSAWGADVYYSDAVIPWLQALSTGFTSGAWLQDPTNGAQDYLVGAMNAPNLIVDEPDHVRFRVMVAQNDANEEQGSGSFYKMASLRLECAQSYGAGLYLIDVKQVPSGCPAWPSFWLLGFPDLEWKWQGVGANNRWPDFGEIDIVEQWGVHGSNNFNATTCHTSPGCSVTFESRRLRNFGRAHRYSEKSA
ncbi:hypothetical protein EBZ37_15115, partial [bacterium]|nr:hypothetical protein [bacterium]